MHIDHQALDCLLLYFVCARLLVGDSTQIRQHSNSANLQRPLFNNVLCRVPTLAYGLWTQVLNITVLTVIGLCAMGRHTNRTLR